jgi:hypothetical protein
VHFDDPSGKRASTEGKVEGAHVFAGVKSPTGMTLPTGVTKLANGGFDHDIVIPFDTTLQLVVFSKAFAIADDKGAGVDKAAGASVGINVPHGTTPPPKKFVITGVN